MSRTLWKYLCISVIATLSGCEDSMRDQARIKPLEENTFFEDHRSARLPPSGTVARGQLREDRAFFTGRAADGFVRRVPLPITREVLQRGRERYTIYCSVCHGADGYGKGTIVQRGFIAPSSYHLDRLRSERDGYFYDVITNGKGAMYSYASRVAPQDRWAIVAYIRALQLSQNSKLGDVPEQERTLLRENDQ
jgi:cytochrome c553